MSERSSQMNGVPQTLRLRLFDRLHLAVPVLPLGEFQNLIASVANDQRDPPNAQSNDFIEDISENRLPADDEKRLGRGMCVWTQPGTGPGRGNDRPPLGEVS